MGTQNSTPRKMPPQRKEEDDGKLQYAPKPHHPQNPIVPSRANIAATKTAAGSANPEPLHHNQHQHVAPPPPYSSLDPRVEQPAQIKVHPVPLQFKTPELPCKLCYQYGHSNVECPQLLSQVRVPPPNMMNIPRTDQTTAPSQPPMKQQFATSTNPYKWTNQDSSNCQSPTLPPPKPSSSPFHGMHQQPPLTVNTAQYKWTSQDNSNRQQSNPSPKPSPTYDLVANPYVWKSSQPGSPGIGKPGRNVIDFDFDMPKIVMSMKENKLPSFQQLNKELSKNKPLADARKSLVNNKYMSDVQFIFNDSTFYAHKMFLITASFLFYEHFHVKGETEMKIEGIEIETFEKVISYCYTDKIVPTEDNVLNLLKAADKLQVRQISNVGHGFISSAMSPDKIFVIFEKAIELESDLFKKKCLDFIAKNEEKCFASKGFYAISLPSLMKILDICKYSSEKNSEIIEKWTSGAMGLFDAKVKPPAAAPPPQPRPVKPQNAAPPPQARPMPSNQKQTGAVHKANPPPKPAAQNQQKKKQQKQPIKQQVPGPIPDLMSLPIPNIHSGPPMVSPFSFPPPLFAQPPFKIEPIRPFANPQFQNVPVAQLINFDDDDDNDSIISKDDETVKIKITVNGKQHQMNTEYSRLDFVCRRSFLLHEIWFSENLAANSKNIHITITVFEQGRRSDVHNRTITNNKGMRFNFVKFNKKPLKIYIGQQFTIKLNFTEAAQRVNIVADHLTLNNYVELHKEGNAKKYFNCVRTLTVSDMSQ